MGAFGMLTLKEESIANLTGLLLPGKAALDSGDTAGLHPGKG